ncbi:hypothetical protein Goari_011583 [Gossypium aridum]|uniref:Uncharacterized protein n=1 Tax=Gossypium aridum TaxID=34290 RepID=A0A7J8WXR0_GOSAI|nr:hypothetical protein [Gossypium aridum]
MVLMVLSQYEYNQCIPATTGLNRVEALVQDPRFWKKLEKIRIKDEPALKLMKVA